MKSLSYLAKPRYFACFFMLFFFVSTLGQEKKESETQSNAQKQEQRATQKKLENLVSSIKTRLKQPSDSTTSKSDNIEIDGLIIDQTLTKIGHEFYEYFYALWEAPLEIKDYTIFITEKATLSSTSLIWINLNEMIIYQQLLKPRSEEIEEAAKSGVATTLQFLYQYQQDQKQLDGGDMSGSGIY